MAKFATETPARPHGAGKTRGPAATFEGGAGFEKGAKTALFTRAVTDRVEGKFYEPGNDGSTLAGLVGPVVAKDPEWVAQFVPWLRNTANMRSASIVVAAEYAAARGPDARSVIRSAMARADEPAEMLGYWLSRHGRKLPMAVKRGIADGAVDLYSEYSALKYDGQTRRIRMADVINLTHPKPSDPAQSALFRWLLDRRHESRIAPDLSLLPMVTADAELLGLPESERRAAVGRIGEAGWSWERLAGWLPGGMDAEAWETAIPQMGYMALLRNLRNFEQARVSSDVLDDVAAKIADPREVERSRQMPYRFYSAWKFSDTMRFGPALETALDHSLRNVPKLRGRTLVLVDTSASMTWTDRSKIAPVHVAAVFAAGLAASTEVDLVVYANEGRMVQNVSGLSVLRTVQDLDSMIGSVGHGTNTWPNAAAAFDPTRHDRVIVLTDMQDHPSHASFDPDVPIYVWDLQGYAAANIDLGRGRYLLSGFTDAHFSMIDRLESARDGAWPWMT